MKKVLVIGASGSLANYVIKELQTQNDVYLSLFYETKEGCQAWT